MMMIVDLCLLLLSSLPLFHAFLWTKSRSILIRPLADSNKGHHHSIGIDLGTTYSLVTIIENKRPHILSIDGSRLLPSVVHYQSNGQVLVGKEAEEMLAVDPLHTFSSIKRLVGRTMKEVKESGDDLIFRRQLLPVYPSNDNSNDTTTSHSTNNSHSSSSRKGMVLCGLRCDEKILLPEEILSQIVKKLIQRASQYYQNENININNNINKRRITKITHGVITIPAYFNHQQIERIERAGLLAGLEKVKLLKEPEAAALAYGFNLHDPQVILVFDLGGGTFDVSVLEVGGGLVEVIATSGDGHLGGDDFDQVIVDWIWNHMNIEGEYYPQEVMDKMKGDVVVKKIVLRLAQDAKVSLSTAQQVTIPIQPILSAAIQRGIIIGQSFDESFHGKRELILTRRGFEKSCVGLLQRLLRPLREAALLAGINLPGESGQLAESILKDWESDDVDKEEDDDQEKDSEVDIPLNPNDISKMDMKELEIAQKSGRREAKRKQKLRGDSRKEMNRLRKTTGDNSLDLFPGGQPLNDVILVGGATRMPCIVKLVRTLTHIDPKRNINPDEAVALGAGVLSGILDGKIDQMQVISAWQAACLRAMQEHEGGLDSFLTQSELKDKESSPSTPTKEPIVAEDMVKTSSEEGKRSSVFKALRKDRKK